LKSNGFDIEVELNSEVQKRGYKNSWNTKTGL